MSGEIGQAFVRIRPNTSGFKAEAESGIKGAFAGIGKLAGATFVVGGIAEAASSVAKAAASQQEEMAAVRQGIISTNSAWVIHGKTVTEVLDDQARATGFTVSELSQAFNRIQLATKDTAKSFQILGAAENVARAQHRSTEVTSLALVRAYEGSSQSLRRFGLVIPNVTVAQDALTKSHLAAIAAGAKFTSIQNAVYKQRLQAAKAADKQATSENVLTVAQARFGGQAATFAKTSAGEFARLHETVNQFEVSIGTNLLPTLNSAARGLRSFFDSARSSKSASGDAQALGGAIKSTFQGIAQVAQFLAPILQKTVDAAQAVFHTLGGGGVVAAVVGFKSLGVATNFVATAQARYHAILAAGKANEAASAAAASARAGSIAGTVAATNAATAAVDKDSIALTRNIDAMIASQAAAERLAASQAALAAKYQVTNIAAFGGGNVIRDAGGKFVTTTAKVDAFANSTGQAGSKLGQFARGAFAAFGGWTTVAAIGLGAVAYGLYRVVSADSSLESANKRLLTSQQALDSELQRTVDLTKKVEGLKAQIPIDKQQVANAKLAVATAAGTLAQSKATKGSLEYQQQVGAVVDAIQNLHNANRNLRLDQKDLDKSQGNLGASHRKSARDARESASATVAIAKAEAQAALQQQRFHATRLGRAGVGASDDVQAQRARGAAAEAFARDLGHSAEKEKNATLKRNEQLIAALARQNKQVPSARQIRFVLSNTDLKATLGGLLFQLDSTTTKAKTKAATGGHQTGSAYDHGIAAGITDNKSVVNNAVDSMLKAAHKAGLDAIGAHSPSKVAREEIGHAISDGIALGILDKSGGVAGALTNQLDAAIQSGVQNVQQAILAAKQNLFSISGSLTTDVTNFLSRNGIGAGGKLTGPAATALARLNKEIASGKATPDAIRAAQALQNQISARQSVRAGQSTTDAIQRRFADIADLANKGAITQAEAIKDVKAVLSEHGVTGKNVQGALGIAAADQLRADIKGFADQLKAIVASPKFGGAGLAPQIIKPLETIRQEQSNIADAAKQQRDKQIAEAKKLLAEQKRHAKLLEKIHGAQVAANSLDVATAKVLKNAGITQKEFDAALNAARHRHGN